MTELKNPKAHLGGDQNKEVSVLNPAKTTEKGKKNKEFLNKFHK